MKCQNSDQAALIPDTTLARRLRESDVCRAVPEGAVDFARLAVSLKRYLDTKLGCFRSLLGMKTKFDEFLGFLRSRCPTSNEPKQ